MKKLYLITASILFFYAQLFAQYSTDWIKPSETYQKIGVMIARDNQDNVIATGYWTANNIYTRKYNKFGVLQWEVMSASGIPGNYEKPLWVTTDVNNNVFVAGYRYAGTNTPNAVVVLKYSADGNQLWKQVISPVNYLAGMNLRCELDDHGNLYVGAAGVGVLPGFALIKFDTNGNILFTQHSDVNAPAYFESMRVKGNKIVMSASGGDPNISVIASWDTSGTFLWSAGVQGRGARDVEIDDAGNMYLLTGYFNQVTATSQMDVEMFKFDASGTQLWKKDFDFGGSDFPTRFIYASGKLSVIGESQGGNDWITFQVDTEGAMLWNTIYNGTSSNVEAPYFIAAKSSGEVFVTGKGGPDVPDVSGSTFLRMITLKYSNTGVQQWIDSTNIYSGWGYACTLASDNSLYVLSGTAMTVFHYLDHNGAGSCNIPPGLNVSDIGDNSATFSWTPVSGATLYHLRYKLNTANTWTVVSYDQPSITVYGLFAGANYEYAVEAICSNGPTGYGATQTFSTTGTGVCTSAGQSQAQEYLSQLWIQGGGIFNSGNDNGYGDFTNNVILLTRDQNVQGYLSALVPYPEYEYYSIWIDYNHDNDFDDAGEEVVSLYTDFTGLIAFNFTIPSTVNYGTTRMRIVMNHDNAPSPCGVYARGETEDYTVQINDNGSAVPPVPVNLGVTDITYSRATFSWTPDNNAASYRLRFKKINESNWTVVPVNTASLKATGLSANTDYVYACEAISSAGPSGFSDAKTFTTTAVVVPITGIDIHARRQGRDVLISWTTEMEQNSAYFDVERSTDGIAYTKIGQVTAAGSSNNIRRYTYTDQNTLTTQIFYRLKMADSDAGFRYSPTRIVGRMDENKPTFLLYPNPAIDQVTLLLTEAATERLQVKVTNQSGQQVKTTQVLKGTQLINLNVNDLPSGIYNVTVTGNGLKMVNKLLIQ